MLLVILVKQSYRPTTIKEISQCVKGTCTHTAMQYSISKTQI